MNEHVISYEEINKLCCEIEGKVLEDILLKKSTLP